MSTKRRSNRPSPRRKPDSDALRLRLFEAMIEHAPYEGWTDAAWRNALRDTRLTVAEAAKLCPEGIKDLVSLLHHQTDKAMRGRIQATRNFNRMRTRDKVALGVRARLEHLEPYREAMRRLVTWYALPAHMPLAVRQTYDAADAVWEAAGDTATDYNRYTKRLLLAGIMKATLLVWLGDESHGREATWEFLDKRIADVMKIGKGIGLLREFTPSELLAMARKKFFSA